MLKARSMGKDELADFLSQGEPTAMEFFKANVSEGFDNSLPGVAWNEVKESFAGGFDQKAEDALSSRTGIPASGTKADETLKTFTEEEWKSSEYFREGVKFQGGWSEGRAKYLAENFDERKEREVILSKGDTGYARKGMGFVGQIVGSLPDPINLIPFGGVASKGAKIGEKIIRGTIEGAAGNLAVSGISRPYWEDRGVESTWQDYVNDLWIGGVMGGGFSAAGHAYSKVKDRRANVSVKDRATLAKAGDAAIEANIRGEDLDLTKVEGLQESFDSVFDIPEVQRSRKVQDLTDQLTEMGYSPEDAKTHISPIVAQAEAFARDFDMSIDDFLVEHGPTFQKSSLEGGRIVKVTENSARLAELLDSEIQTMAKEIQFAEKGGKKIFDDGQFVGTTGEGSFPSWYREAGVKNKEHLAKILESKKGPVYERLQAIAEDRLMNGYETPTSRSAPSNEYLSLVGKEQVEIPVGPDGEPLFQSKFRRDKGLQVEQSSRPLPDDFIKVEIKSDPSISFKFNEKDLTNELRHAFEGNVKNTHTGRTIEINEISLGKMVSFVMDDISNAPGQLRRDYLEIARNIKQVLADAVYFEKATDSKGKNRGEFRYMVSEVEVDGRNYLAQLQVSSDGRMASLYNMKLVDMKGYKKEGRATGSSFDGTGKAAIPPSMDTLSTFREKINHAKGKSKYFKGDKGSERGAITFDQQGKSVIHLFENADQSTIIHETGHLFLNNLEKFAGMEKASPQLKADLQVMRDWMGLKSGEKIQIKHHEQFARGFEQYLREGKAPRKELQSVFSRFKDWLTALYKSSKELKVNLSDEAREVYSRLLGGESRPRVDIKQEVVAPEPTFKSDADIDAKTSEIQIMVESTPGLARAEEVIAFQESIVEIETEEKALDEVMTFFQGAKDEKSLQEAAARAGISKTQFEKIIDDFNQKLMNEDEARLGLEKLIEQKRKELAAEAAELKRQAYLSLSARTQVMSHVQKVMEAGGSAKDSVLSILEGASHLRGIEGAGNSVDGSYMALAQTTSSKVFTELRKIDSKIERLFEDDIQFNENVIKEMITPGSTGDDVAKQASEILSRYSNELRERANLAGATIGKLEGHVPRTHDLEKMVGKMDEWVNFMMENLDPERSFKGLEEAEKRSALMEVYASLVSDNHGAKEIDVTEPLRRAPRNIAKKMGESRSLHFKSAEVELAYLKEFGQGDNILQSMASHFENMSRKIAMMERLGPNPENTIAHVIQNIHDDIKAKIISGEMDSKTAQKVLDEMGDVNKLKSRDSDIGHAMMQALGEVDTTQGFFKNASRLIRGINSLSKLGSALLSQPTDFVHAVNERRLLTERNEASLWIEVLKDYFSRPDKNLQEVLDHVGIYVDSINYKNFNRFDADNINNKLARANDWMFRWTGQNWHVKHSKQAAALSLAREMGSNISKSWGDMHPGLKEMLVQYGSFNETKWEMIRKAKPLEVDGKAYYHPGMINDLADDVFDSMLPEDLQSKSKPSELPIEGESPADLKKWEDKRAAELKRARFKLEMDLKTFFLEESRNAAPEPDAKIRRVMSFGSKAGTKTAEAVKLITQFKTFAFVNYDRSIKGRRMMKHSSDYGGLAHHAVATLALGYLSTVLKDLAKGIEPADPTDVKAWGRAAFQSGGLGIMGDFLQSGMSSRSGYDALGTLAGPTFSTAGSFINLTGKTLRGDVLEDGAGVASDWIDFGRSLAPAPFSSMWYTRAAMDHLIWQNLKETLEPGSIRRSERRLKKQYNQKYLMSPKETQWLPQLSR